MPKIITNPASDKGSGRKVRKPHPDFPLTPHHGTGRWCKKVRGKVHYFGPLDNPQAALEKWLDQKDDLLAGRVPMTPVDGLTLADLVNKFLATKRHLVETGELTARTWADYQQSCQRAAKILGKNRVVPNMSPDDFQRLRTALSKTLGHVALGNEIQRIRVLFKYAYDAGLIDRPMRYGPTFRRPSKKVLREERNRKGERMFEPAELRRLIAAAGQPLKTMILIALNTGYGNNDVGLVPISAIDLDGGWATFPRPKTAIKRRCPLWPETVDALRAWLAVRPKAKDEADAGLAFLTRRGQSWSKGRELTLEKDDKGQTTLKGNRANPLSHEFRKLLHSCKLYRPGASFYTLRHVFETVAGEAKDQPATDSIMGHVDASMAGTYRERISDDRLRDVTDHVRAWLYGDAVADTVAGNDPAALLAAYQAAVVAYAENPTDENRLAQDQAHLALMAAFAANGGHAPPKKAK